ncbi:WXG100 family type VII secretion target [Streptomyces sp. NPDC058548]|uniref:WXG100 family type VII secretion target n=1 Tax=unclassified Streptomyces TaxID=2593676 RepID=UPI00365B73A6
MTTPSPNLNTSAGFRYATEQMREAIDQLRKGNDDIEEIVKNLKSNVELNFEGWVGGSKDEFLRVHAQTTDHTADLAQWLSLNQTNVQRMIQDAVDDDSAQASRFSGA